MNHSKDLGSHKNVTENIIFYSRAENFSVN